MSPHSSHSWGTEGDVPNAMVVSPAEGHDPRDGKFYLQASEDFGILRNIAGGFLNGAAINAAQQYLSAVLDSASSLDIVGNYIQFLSRTPPGVITFSCRLLRQSSFQTVVNVDVASRPGTMTAVTTITFGDTSKERGISQNTRSSMTVSLPNRERDCIEVDHPHRKVIPMLQKFRWSAPRGDGLWGHHAGGNFRDLFVGLADRSSIDLSTLGWLTDLGMQPPLTDERDLGSQLQISTVSLTNEYKRPVPDSMEWVLIRTYTHVVRNGRYDVDAFVIDPATSEILALSRHIIYVKPHQVSLKQLVADKEGNEAAKM